MAVSALMELRPPLLRRSKKIPRPLTVLTWSSINELIVLWMRSDPEPYQALRPFLSQCSIVKTHPGGPKDANLFESDRRMSRARLQKGEVLIGKISDLFRQLAIVKPELRRGEVLQRGVQRPASKSSSARLPAASRRPALMSCSI